MILPKLTITYPNSDEVTVVPVTPRTEVLWERRFGVPYMSFIIPFMTVLEATDDITEALQVLEVDQLYYLAFCAVTKAQGEYEDWLDTIGAVQLGATEPQADDAAPLDPAGVGSPEPPV